MENKSATTSAFLDCMNWVGASETGPTVTTYQASNVSINTFKKTEQMLTTEGEASPTYTVWEIPKPPKQYVVGDVRAPVVPVFASAADALNPKPPPPPQSEKKVTLAPPLPPRPASAETTNSAPLLPPSSFVEGLPFAFLISPAQAYKHKAVSEHQSKYKYTATTAKEAKADSIDQSRLDVTSQRVFTTKQAYKVLTACKLAQAIAAKKPAVELMKTARAGVEKGLTRRRSVQELKEVGIVKEEEADVVAKRRNSCVEVERMLVNRPEHLPDGRGLVRGKKEEVIAKALVKRASAGELVEKNIIKEVCESTNTTAVERTRRSSVGALTELHVNMQEKKEAEIERKGVGGKKKKKRKEAVIPVRAYKPVMENTAAWKYGDKYSSERAVGYRNVKVGQMKKERRVVHHVATEEKKVSVDRFFGKYGRREVWAKRFNQTGLKNDRRVTTHKRDFVWHDVGAVY